MARALFAEQFAVPTEVCPPGEPPRYDERRQYSVTADGLPHVEMAPLASTNTLTRADAEPADTDRSAWERALALGTRTQASRDRDYW